ncbi:MAG: class I SAM-dependent methyltransferase [Pseudonocardia sp.]
MTRTDAAESYIIDPGWGAEDERLRLLAQECDPWTSRQLDRVGVTEGWRCLDVGAGNGSVARMLADRVGPRGRVVASDVDTRFLTGDLDGVEVLCHDVLVDDFPDGSFDLVHTRVVVTHLPDRPRAIERMTRWLRPGGVLLLEELQGLVVPWAADPVWRGLWQATEKVPAMDLGTGGSLPGWLTEAGLVDVAPDGWVTTVRGGSGMARFADLLVDALATPMQAAGLWRSAEIGAVKGQLADPDFVDFWACVISCSGRRPV